MNTKLGPTFARFLYIAILIAVSIGLVLWQAARVAPMIDITYMVESANRIFWGQVPYEDFYLVLPPGTFYIMSWLMEWFGKDYSYQIYYLAFNQSLLIVVTYALVRKYNKDTLTSCLLALLPALGGHAILPFPSYDIPAFLFVSFALYAFIECNSTKSYFVLGILAFLPTLFKQNVGLVFLFALGGLLFLKIFTGEKKKNVKNFLSFALGSGLSIGIFLWWLYSIAGLHDFFYQCFTHPGKIRNPLDALLRIGNDFTSRSAKRLAYPLVAMLIAERIPPIAGLSVRIKNTTLFNLTEKHLTRGIVILIALLFGRHYIYKFIKEPTMAFIANFWPIIIATAVYWVIRQRKITNKRLAIIVVITSCFASFLSQGFWGSSYGLWGMCAVLLAATFSLIPQYKLFTSGIIVILCIAMVNGLYTNDRLQYVPLSGEVQAAPIKHMTAIGTPGDWLPEIHTIEQFINTEIKPGESFTQVPGEDPLYYITDREPHLKYFQLNSTTFLHDGVYMFEDIVRNNIKWVIVKTKPQCPGGFIGLKKLNQRIEEEYTLYKELKSYKIYKAKN